MSNKCCSGATGNFCSICGTNLVDNTYLGLPCKQLIGLEERAKNNVKTFEEEVKRYQKIVEQIQEALKISKQYKIS